MMDRETLLLNIGHTLSLSSKDVIANISPSGMILRAYNSVTQNQLTIKRSVLGGGFHVTLNICNHLADPPSSSHPYHGDFYYYENLCDLDRLAVIIDCFQQDHRK